MSSDWSTPIPQRVQVLASIARPTTSAARKPRGDGADQCGRSGHETQDETGVPGPRYIFSRPRDDRVNALLRFGLAKSGYGGHQPGEVGAIIRLKTRMARGCKQNASCLRAC